MIDLRRHVPGQQAVDEREPWQRWIVRVDVALLRLRMLLEIERGLIERERDVALQRSVIARREQLLSARRTSTTMTSFTHETHQTR
jgi:hypothetical protein